MKRLKASFDNIYNNKKIWFELLAKAVKLNNDFTIGEINTEKIKSILNIEEDNLINNVAEKLKQCTQDEYQKNIIKENNTVKMDYKPIIKLGILHFVNVTIKYGLDNEIKSCKVIPETFTNDFEMIFVLGENKIPFVIADRIPFFESNYLYNKVEKLLINYVNNYENNVLYEYSKKFVKDNEFEADFVIEDTTECLKLKDNIGDTILSFKNADYNNRENIFACFNHQVYFGKGEYTHGQLISKILQEQIHDGTNRPTEEELNLKNIDNCIFGHYNNKCAFIDAIIGNANIEECVSLLLNNEEEIVYKIYLSNDEERFTRNWIRKARKR